jgi:hypothetical protein
MSGYPLRWTRGWSAGLRALVQTHDVVVHLLCRQFGLSVLERVEDVEVFGVKVGPVSDGAAEGYPGMQPELVDSPLKLAEYVVARGLGQGSFKTAVEATLSRTLLDFAFGPRQRRFCRGEIKRVLLGGQAQDLTFDAGP